MDSGDVLGLAAIAGIVVYLATCKGGHVVAPVEGTKEEGPQPPGITIEPIDQLIGPMDTTVRAYVTNHDEFGHSGTVTVTAELEPDATATIGWDPLFTESVHVTVPGKSSAEVALIHSDVKETAISRDLFGTKYRLTFKWE